MITHTHTRQQQAEHTRTVYEPSLGETHFPELPQINTVGIRQNIFNVRDLVQAAGFERRRHHRHDLALTD
jgi:hypothetical protein